MKANGNIRTITDLEKVVKHIRYIFNSRHNLCDYAADVAVAPLVQYNNDFEVIKITFNWYNIVEVNSKNIILHKRDRDEVIMKYENFQDLLSKK